VPSRVNAPRRGIGSLADTECREPTRVGGAPHRRDTSAIRLVSRRAGRRTEECFHSATLASAETEQLAHAAAAVVEPALCPGPRSDSRLPQRPNVTKNVANNVAAKWPPDMGRKPNAGAKNERMPVTPEVAGSSPVAPVLSNPASRLAFRPGRGVRGERACHRSATNAIRGGLARRVAKSRWPSQLRIRGTQWSGLGGIGGCGTA
jgi:hypothetical protein